MSVISFDEQLERDGDDTSEPHSSVLELVNRKYKRNFVATTDTITDGPVIVKADYRCPKIGDTYAPTVIESDSLATCVSVQCRATASPYVWFVEVQYDTARLVQAALTNPLNAPAEINWSPSAYERPLVRDTFGAALVNSSNEFFDPPVMVEDSRPTLTITRNELSYSNDNQIAYQDAVNADIFAGRQPGYAKMNITNAVRMYDLGLIYYKITYEIQFRRESFWIPILDQGFRDKNGNLFRDPIDSSPLANPTPLNGRGEKWTTGLTTLSGDINAGVQNITVADGVTHFPPGTPSPPHWYFEVKIDNEIMQVQGGRGTNNWVVQRAYAGTTAAAHNNGAQVKLQPYYLRFMPFKFQYFAPLNLPVI